MEKITNFNNQTAGRDKLARLLQYLSRLIWHYMQKRSYNKKSIETLKTLEYTFGNFRKLLRLGRCFDTLHSALKSLHYKETLVRLTCTFSKIAHAFYLLCDHVVWAGRTGVADIDTDRWSYNANRYWLLSIYCNLIRDAYEIFKLIQLHNQNCSSSKRSVMRKTHVTNLIISNKEVAIDTLKNACDVLIPLTALGFVKLSPGATGLLGVISSIAGIVTIVDPFSKLAPS
ncbi:hypothetical protein LSTR_LSTR007527 [Laodelphax striatellus]|uniref:Peroxisomal membrane protein 11B n=1 Tax=Laodelphax striatellus TaxID=195883 RepID=A0A482XS77_LAOST|nr:hypothetical protein LSTR_LSTR007527 [Laodelphax striatellus]